MTKKIPKSKTPMTSENFVLDKFIFSLARGAFKKTPMFNEALERAKEEYFIPSKMGKPMRRVRWKCAGCGKTFTAPESKKKRAAKEGVDVKDVSRASKDVSVDHISPAIDVYLGFQDWLTYFQRLFCSVDNLQVLCSYSQKKIDDGTYTEVSCHTIKTQAENKIRKQAAKDRKKKNGQVL